ncbi:hypothetical protein GCM10020370_29990 [Paenibacillus hodogayensis]
MGGLEPAQHLCGECASNCRTAVSARGSPVSYQSIEAFYRNPAERSVPRTPGADKRHYADRGVSAKAPGTAAYQHCSASLFETVPTRNGRLRLRTNRSSAAWLLAKQALDGQIDPSDDRLAAQAGR